MPLFVMYDLGSFRTLLTGANIPADKIDEIVAEVVTLQSRIQMQLVDLNGDIAPGADKIQVTSEDTTR